MSDHNSTPASSGVFGEAEVATMQAAQERLARQADEAAALLASMKRIDDAAPEIERLAHLHPYVNSVSQLLEAAGVNAQSLGLEARDVEFIEREMATQPG
jgi:chaperonin cofactor prefoldin